jgi:glycosyltransferase involved in cell wall biosynthesis
LKKNPERYSGKSIVFYPHREDEIGSIEHQVEILNQCFAVYFMCTLNADELVSHGLDKNKVRLVYFALDVDCIRDNKVARNLKTVVLASRYGPRKGLELLPELIREMPDWNFIALGRNWEEFIDLTGLSSLSNFSYILFDKKTRSENFSKAGVFLSLSNLEGGPVPLIEAMLLDLIPIATDTGFARDLIVDNENGFLLKQCPSVNEVKEAIQNSSSISEKPSAVVKHLTWDRFSQIVLMDHREIMGFHGLAS